MTTPHSSSQSRSRFVLVALVSAALLAAGPSPASVAGASEDHRVIHLDARHDVVLIDLRSEARSPAPADRSADITKTVVDHQAEQLVIQTRVRDLGRSGFRLMVAEILASDGVRYDLTVDYSTRPSGSRIDLRRRSGYAVVSCPGARSSIKRSVDKYVASVPTSCLENPEWLRVGLGIAVGPYELKDERVDDSRTRGRIGEQHLSLGPRQHAAS